MAPSHGAQRRVAEWGVVARVREGVRGTRDRLCVLVYARTFVNLHLNVMHSQDASRVGKALRWPVLADHMPRNGR